MHFAQIMVSQLLSSLDNHVLKCLKICQSNATPYITTETEHHLSGGIGNSEQ